MIRRAAKYNARPTLYSTDVPRSRFVRALLRVAGPVWRIRRVALWSEAIFWALWLRQNRGEVALRVSADLPFPDVAPPPILCGHSAWPGIPDDTERCVRLFRCGC